MRVKVGTADIIRAVLIGALIIAIAVVCLSLSNDRFIEECKKKGGAISTTSNGHYACTLPQK